MKAFSTTTSIRATPQRIWDVLVDTARWPEWDPYCERVEGAVALGARLAIYTKLSPGRAFPVRVTALEPPKRMEWTGGLPLGLLRGVRVFGLTPAGDTTTFSVNETFSGPLLPLIGPFLPDMTEPFQRFAAGLKERAEGRPGVATAPVVDAEQATG